MIHGVWSHAPLPAALVFPLDSLHRRRCLGAVALAGRSRVGHDEIGLLLLLLRFHGCNRQVGLLLRLRERRKHLVSLRLQGIELCFLRGKKLLGEELLFLSNLRRGSAGKSHFLDCVVELGFLDLEVLVDCRVDDFHRVIRAVGVGAACRTEGHS